MKTSATHPLRIDEVRLASGSRIGLTFCPGKKQPHASTGPWDRDLHADLAVIQDWGAQAVVTLMEETELASVKVATIGDEVERLGMEWYFLPIVDVDVPDDVFENRWIYAGHRLRRLLQANGRILIHCRGGLGRTGTIAARLLVESGWEPQAAIQAVRTARPGAIETSAQKHHVLAAKPPSHDEAFLERALGCLFGGAIGDAFGYAVEFDSLATIRRKFGKKGLQKPVLQNGRLIVSDDTQMTLFTLEGLLCSFANSGEPDSASLITEIQKAYLDWLSTQVKMPKGWKPAGSLCKRPNLRHQRAPGNTCLSALMQGGTGTKERPPNNSKGCGGVMRVAPLGWITTWPRWKAHHAAVDAAVLTHGHPSGYISAGALAAIVYGLFNGRKLKDAVNDGRDQLYTEEQKLPRAEVAEKVEQALLLARKCRTSPIKAIRALGEGWVGEEALGIGLYAALTGRDFEDAIARAANHDGDSDSTASIAGQLYGAWKGVSLIPHRLIRCLDVFDEIVHLSRHVAALPLKAASTANIHDNPAYQQQLGWCLNVLEMVHELHRRGYQRLRICPGMSPSGCHWRAAVTPVDNISRVHGAMIDDFDRAAHYTTGQENHYFGWRDAEDDDSTGLADRFIERHQDLCRAGQGRDWAYAGWYTEMLGLARRGHLPIAYADWHEPPPARILPVMFDGEMRDPLPLPPGGEAAPREESDRVELRLQEERTLPTHGGQTSADAIDLDTIPISSLDIADDQQRQTALLALYFQWEEQLLPFVTQVWDRLGEPREERCIMMAHHAGVSGTGKIALRRVLKKFFDECEKELEATGDLPSLEACGDMDAWFAECQQHFGIMDQILEKIAKKYSRILNGEDPNTPDPPVPSAIVIQGPWKPLST